LHVYLAGRHVELTDELRAYVQAHLIDAITTHTGMHINRLEVQLFADGEKGNHFGCHVLVETKGHRDINVREVQDTLPAAVDVARDRVINNLTEMRDRLLTLRRHPKKFSWARLGRALGWVRAGRANEA
jgi:ribosome-associated translation inhibitor RaiA